MIQRGGFSFVAMLVINPFVILFYQNCSMAPISHASKVAQTIPPSPAIIESQSRSISSDRASAIKMLPAHCLKQNANCPTSTIE